MKNESDMEKQEARQKARELRHAKEKEHLQYYSGRIRKDMTSLGKWLILAALTGCVVGDITCPCFGQQVEGVVEVGHHRLLNT